MVPTKQIIRWNWEDPTCRHSNHQKGDKKLSKAKHPIKNSGQRLYLFAGRFFAVSGLVGNSGILQMFLRFKVMDERKKTHPFFVN